MVKGPAVRPGEPAAPGVGVSCVRLSAERGPRSSGHKRGEPPHVHTCAHTVQNPQIAVGLTWVPTLSLAPLPTLTPHSLLQATQPPPAASALLVLPARPLKLPRSTERGRQAGRLQSRSGEGKRRWQGRPRREDRLPLGAEGADKSVRNQVWPGLAVSLTPSG